MPQTGTAGSRRSPRGDSSLPPALVPLDPTGEITAIDRHAADRHAADHHAADHHAADRGAVAEEFAARFGLDRGISPVEITGRRTVTITGRGAEVYVPRRARDAGRPTQPRHERVGFRADRAAMWAVMLGLLLIFVAAASAHAATLYAVAALH